MLERGSRVSRGRARRRNDDLGRARAARGSASSPATPTTLRRRSLLTVGNDCAVGKMTVSLELVRAANAAGIAARFVPTGQTGILIAGWGISVDRVIADFAPGAAEQLVLYAAHEGADLIVVEGQGAINHPAYAPVTLALMSGARRTRSCSLPILAARAIESYATPTLRYREADRAARTPARNREAGQGRRHRAEHARALRRSRPARKSNGRAREDRTSRATTSCASAQIDSTAPSRRQSSSAPLEPRRHERCRTRWSPQRSRSPSRRALARDAQNAVRGQRNAWTVPGVLRIGEDEEPDNLNLMFAHTAAADDDRRSALFVPLALRRAGQLHSGSRNRRSDDPATAASAATARRIVVHLRRKGVGGPTARRSPPPTGSSRIAR